MKKAMMMAAVAMMTAMSVNAQSDGYDTKHEVSITYGQVSTSQILDVFSTIGSALVGVSEKNESWFGPLAAEYFYHVSDVVGVGGIVAIGERSYDMLRKEEKLGEGHDQYYTLMPAVKFNWLRKQHFGMYSKAAIGATLRHMSQDTNGDNYTDTSAHINYQASLLGLEAGSPTVRGFLELGFGEQGIILLGMRYKF